MMSKNSFVQSSSDLYSNDHIGGVIVPTVTNIGAGVLADSYDGAAGRYSFTRSPTIVIDETTELRFPDGTTMSGEMLLKCMKVLQRIVENDYPEELL